MRLFLFLAIAATGLAQESIDTFIARWKNRAMDADAYVTFSLKPDGPVVAAVSPLTDFSFDFHHLVFEAGGRCGSA